MNKLTFLIEPGDNQIGYAAALIVKLLSDGAPGSPRPHTLDVRIAEYGQIRIIAEYPEIAASAPLLHSLKTVKNPNRMSLSPYRRNRRCTVSARPERRH